MNKSLFLLLLLLPSSAYADGYMVYDRHGSAQHLIVEERGGYSIIAPDTGEFIGLYERQNNGDFVLWDKHGQYRGTMVREERPPAKEDFSVFGK